MTATTTKTRADPTPNQILILAFIARHYRTKGLPPTVREIGKEFGIRSPNGVMCHLRALQRKGLVEVNGVRNKHMKRQLRLVGAHLELAFDDTSAGDRLFALLEEASNHEYTRKRERT